MPQVMKIVPFFALLLAILYLLSPDGLGGRFDIFTPINGEVPYNKELFSIEMKHLGPNEYWAPSLASVIIMVGVFFLYLELHKATRTSDLSVIDHTLSLIVFVAYFATFLTREWAGNSLFFIISAMAFLDVAAGLTITISGARRDFNLGGGH
ncbi:MAG TPA: hypothetical protein ENK78_03875 [Thiothrix sp.]|nr:hypothetical protein [Thiothrix sp.]